MSLDVRLLALIKSIQDKVESIVNQQIDTDTTLTKSGKAADAKAVGAEIQDIRTEIESIADQSIKLDTTLTKPGEAADAKAVGTQIRDIQTKVDSKLSSIQIKIEDDGNMYYLEEVNNG